MADENNYRKSVDSAGVETKLTPASDKDVDKLSGTVKGDASESGSNSYAKNNQKSIDSLNKIYKRYKAAKDESSASTREKGRG